MRAMYILIYFIHSKITLIYSSLLVATFLLDLNACAIRYFGNAIICVALIIISCRLALFFSHKKNEGLKRVSH